MKIVWLSILLKGCRFWVSKVAHRIKALTVSKANTEFDLQDPSGQRRKPPHTNEIRKALFKGFHFLKQGLSM